jgi:hypothetical protein
MSPKSTAGAQFISDPLAQFSGPVETVAASVPRDLIDAIRATTGKRKFSQFVGRALARELIDTQRAEFVAGMEAIHGPVDPELVNSYAAVLDR